MFIHRFFAVAAIAVLAFPAAAQVPQQPEVRVETTQFARGTVNVVPPQPTAEETFTGPLTLRQFINAHPEINWKAPDFKDGRPYSDPRTRTLAEMAKQVVLRREVYSFEFAFKPLRQIYIDIPQPNGRMQRKLIWYMVYRVRYLGGDLRAAPDPATEAPYGRIEAISYKARRCFPLLVLSNHTSGKEYVDRILPAAKKLIAQREKLQVPLHNTVEMTTIPIPKTTDPAAPGVWGVATWENIDPKIDFLSIYVSGLTNAFQRIENETGEVQLKRKTLQLNFFRPGDTVGQTEDRIRFGIPAYTDEQEQSYVLEQYGLEKRLDYQWVYR